MAGRGTRTQQVEVCPEALAGTRLEMLVDGDGMPFCDRCGAPLPVIRASQQRVQIEYTAGTGPGWRKPRPDLGEVVYRCKDNP